MIIKVSRYNLSSGVVSRMLYGAKFVNIMSFRQYHYAAGVLTGGALNAGNAVYKPVNFGI